MRLLILAGIWVGFFIAIDPRGQFPLNDDFQYAECARRWLTGGGLHLPEWALSSTITHAALGALMTFPWHASNQALRLWMIVLGGLGAAGVYALARRWRAGGDAALLAALTLALSPLYATLSASFHLDVTVAVLTLAALLAFLRGRERGSTQWLLVASTLTAASGLARQTGFLCVVGAAAALALERRLSARAALALLLPAGLAAAGFGAWLRFVHGPTWAWESGVYSPKIEPGHWLAPGVWVELIRRASNSVQLGALCLSPLALLDINEAARRRPTRGEAAALATLIGVALIGWTGARGLPLIQNTLSHMGLGVVTLMGADDKPAGWWESARLWNAAALIALLSSVVFVRKIARALRGPDGAEIRAAALFVGAPFAAMLLMPILYDRYLLVILPFASAAIAAGCGQSGRRAAPAAAALLILALFTGAGLSDYFAWNRARWAAGMALVARGVPPDRIENGFDWDAQFSLTQNLAALRAKKPAREIGIWDWQTLNGIVAQTTFSASPPQADWTLIGRFPYRTPLVAGGGVVRLFAPLPPASPVR